MVTVHSNTIEDSIKITRKEKLKIKKFKKRRLFFLISLLIILLTTVFIFNIYKTKNTLASSSTALKYYLVDSSDSTLARIDNSELIFSHTNKSIYKVSGMDKDDNFKLLEVCLVKDDSNWSVDYLKNLK